MVKKLTTRISSSKRLDPLVMLPLELAEIVLHQLSFPNIVYAYPHPKTSDFRLSAYSWSRSLRGVSRSWKCMLESIPSLWYHLDLSAAKRPVRFVFIKDCIRFSQYRLKRASLAYCGVGHACLNITEYISRCQRIEHIDILRATDFTWLVNTSHPLKSLTSLTIGREYEIRLEDIKKLLAKYASLQRAEFYSVFSPVYSSEPYHNLAQLKVLRMRYTGSQHLPVDQGVMLVGDIENYTR